MTTQKVETYTLFGLKWHEGDIVDKNGNTSAPFWDDALIIRDKFGAVRYHLLQSEEKTSEVKARITYEDSAFATIGDFERMLRAIALNVMGLSESEEEDASSDEERGSLESDWDSCSDEFLTACTNGEESADDVWDDDCSDVENF